MSRRRRLIVALGLTDARSSTLQPKTWTFLGSGIRARAAAERALGREGWWPAGAELSDVAASLRQPFLDWNASLARRVSNQDHWWASTLGSHSTVQSDLYQQICYAELVRRWTTAESRPDIVVLDDPWLYRELRIRLGDSADFRGSEKTRFALDWLFWKTRRILSCAWIAASVVVCRVFALLVTRGRPPAKADAIIFTWIDSRSIARGAFNDPYTGRLAALLSQAGAVVGRIVPWHAEPFLARRISRIEGILPLAKFLSLKDAALALESFSPEWTGAAGDVYGWPMDAWVRREVLREGGHAAFGRHLVSSRVFRRAAEDLRGARCLIYPFENQPWEKMLCLAFQSARSRASLVGYQHSSVPRLLLNYALGAGEASIAPLPSLIMTNGPASMAVLRDSGFPDSLLRDGGTFRYESLMSARPARQRTARPKRLVVCLSMVPRYSLTLWHDLKEEFAAPLKLASDGAPIEILVKAHPRLPLTGLSRLPPWLRLDSRPLREALIDCDLCLYVPQTAGWWEALALGVPVLKYQTNLLDIDLPPIDEGYPPVCTRATLRQAVLEHIVRKESVGDLNRLLSPVNEQAWMSLVR